MNITKEGDEQYEELAKTLHSHIRAPNQEYIICAANHYDDGINYPHEPKNINSGFVVCGRRHHNIFSSVATILLYFDVITSVSGINNICDQGFMTSKDRFVSREEAAQIAFKAGQTKKLNKILFSEDIY